MSQPPPATPSSLLINALDRAAALALATPPAPAILDDAGEGKGMRGVFGGTPTATTLHPGATIAYLDDIGVQLAQVRTWLHDRPAVLRLLDEGIRGEVRTMERRINRANLLMNVVFTIIGAFIGLVLPGIVQVLLRH